MTVKKAVECLELMKWLKGYDNTTVGGVPIANVIDDIIALLKAQGVATVEPKRIELADETKAWLNKMDAVDALNNIADICIDWDGYRTADGLGGLINEIWAYARYCADRLMKAQEPRVMALEELAAAQKTPVWRETKRAHKDLYNGWMLAYDIQRGQGITGTRQGMTEPNGRVGWCKLDDYGKTWRCWTSRPTDDQREATPWN